ncbi:MAG: diacylglyceryl transferase [Lentimicrobiaceae bacterium]|jgi:phosphatidylglycerol:prolipoprotein diacylglycerol transferase|nr:diacylglyceryl transferase [Lentimicrobiaceae bacterium]MDG1901963.1 prolipoprotein diacylglyceryl transferase [Bacteroidales bacterium]MDG2081002.1 prolipoprotein diacylglyceryl transferase [Bacteroidales bacterium]
MYPRLSDLINDLFGTDINLPIQSYGFFLAMAFFVAGIFLRSELTRKEKLGEIQPTKKKVKIGEPPSLVEMLVTFLTSFILGFKIIGLLTFYDQVIANPQAFVFSMEGSWLGGITIAILATSYQYYIQNKNKLKVPKIEEIIVPAKDQMWPVIFIAVIFGIIGAKVFHQLENMDDFLADPIGSLFSFSGLTFYGGLIVATGAVGYYGEKNGIKWKHMADAVAPSLIIAYGIGRIGCQIAGDGDWGIVNLIPQPEWLSFLPEWTWSYDYPHNIINEGVLMPGCSGAHCYRLAQPVYPTPIYETTLSILIFIALWSIRKKITIPGSLFAAYLMLNGLERFFIEKIRVNNIFDMMGMRVTQAEIISTSLFFLGLVFMIFLIIQNNKTKFGR